MTPHHTARRRILITFPQLRREHSSCYVRNGAVAKICLTECTCERFQRRFQITRSPFSICCIVMPHGSCCESSLLHRLECTALNQDRSLPKANSAVILTAQFEVCAAPSAFPRLPPPSPAPRVSRGRATATDGKASLSAAFSHIIYENDCRKHRISELS